MNCILKTQHTGPSARCFALCSGKEDTSRFLMRNVPSSKYMSQKRTSNFESKISLRKFNSPKKVSPLPSHLNSKSKKTVFLLTKESTKAEIKKYRSLDEARKFHASKNLPLHLNHAPTQKNRKFSWKNKIVESIIIPKR